MVSQLNPKLDGIDDPDEAAALSAKYEEMADALERHFDELPQWKPRANRLGRRY